MDKKLKYSAIAGIVALVAALIDFRLSIIIWGIANIVFEWGFKIIGEKTRNKLLKFSAVGFIIWSVVITLMFIGLSPSAISLSSPIFKHLQVVYGIIGVVFGISLLALKKLLGKIITATVILGITGSALIALSMPADFFISGLDGLLGNIGRFVMFPVCILEIIILFKAAGMKEFK
ncbi:MAG: hypothetical protein GF375_01840 [Candidatus Omnitrophica bacterium]|nr:hypothetical protein [Candidatus Omnitrophota bacterium]MBD3268867.1 hypothetical protein [Candidatus Omnitrophota bacterium]